MAKAISATCFLALTLCLKANGAAQIYECRGVITNKPCGGGAAPLFEEKPYQPPSKQTIEEQKKELWINDLEIARVKVRKEYGIDVNVSRTSDLCRRSSLDECRRAIEDKEKEINQLILVKIASEDNQKEKSDSAAQLPQPVAITIIQDNSYRDLSIIHGPRPGGVHRPPPPDGAGTPQRPDRPPDVKKIESSFLGDGQVHAPPSSRRATSGGAARLNSR